MGFHGPTNYAPAPGIDDDGEVQRASPCRNVRDISDPEAIRPCRGEVALYQVRRGACRHPPDGSVGTLAATDALQACRAHQASHALASHMDAHVL